MLSLSKESDWANPFKKKANKKKVNKYKNVQVSLFHLPNLTAEQVIYNLSKLVNTNYSTFLADDDIIFPKFFDLSVKHLSKDKNLIGVTGKGYCYSLEGNRLKGKIISFGDYPIIDAQEENFTRAAQRPRSRESLQHQDAWA